MDLLVYCSNSLPSSSLQRKINALTEKPRVFLNNQEMMAAMMEGMPLRQLLSFVPGIKREMLEQMVGALNEGFAYNKKNVSMEMKTSVYKGYKQDKIEMRGDRAEMSDFPLYLNTVAGGLDRRDQTIGGFSFVVKIYAVPVVEIIG